MPNTIALALMALLAPIAAHFLWSTAFEETVGCVTLAGSLYWCRTHWKSYVAFMGLLTLALAVTSPLFAFVTGLWILATGGLTLLWEGLPRLRAFIGSSYHPERIDSRTGRRQKPIFSDDENEFIGSKELSPLLELNNSHSAFNFDGRDPLDLFQPSNSDL